ncbi:glycosyltransferase, partial [Dyella japonica]
NGVSSRFNAQVEPYRPGYPYILYPGNMRSYKNVEMLLRAFSQSSLRTLGLKVVLTGTGTPELNATIATLGIAKDVVFMGFVPDVHLVR